MLNAYLVISSALVIGMLFVSRFDRRMNLFAMLLAIVFCFGYVIKILYFRSVSFEFSSINSEYLRFDVSHLNASLPIILAFVAGSFCGVVTCFIIHQKKPIILPQLTKFDSSLRKRLLYLWLACVLFSSFATFIRAALGIGQMGGDAIFLPFGLQTVIFRIQSHLLPLLYVYILTIGILVKEKVVVRLGIIGLLVHYLFGIFSGSKSGVIFALLMIWISYFLTGMVKKRYYLLLPVAGALSVVLYATGLYFRAAKMGIKVGGDSLFDLVLLMFADTEILLKYLMAMGNRVIGMDGLLHVVSSDVLSRYNADHLLALISRTAPKYFTGSIVGLSVENDFRAPGIIGLLYMLSPSIYGVFALGALIPVAYFLLSRLVQREEEAVPFTTMLGLTAFSLFTEGYIVWQDYLTLWGAFLVLTWINRNLIIRREYFSYRYAAGITQVAARSR